MTIYWLLDLDNQMPAVRLDETKIINDFKIIIQDQQKVIE